MTENSLKQAKQPIEPKKPVKPSRARMVLNAGRN